MQSAEWTILSRISCFIQGEVIGFQVLLLVLMSFHGPTHGSAIGASQLLDHGSGTVCQPGFVSPTTTSENFVGS